MAITLGVSFGAGRAQAIGFDDIANKAKGAAESGAKGKAEKEVNDKLLAEGRKNQCSFKTDSDQLMPGCDAKKRLQMAGVKAYKFEVSGHTDSSGKADHNKELSGKRAAVMVKELVARGIQPAEITSIGMGSDKPLVTPDNTPAKKAKNRRYEIQVKFS